MQENNKEYKHVENELHKDYESTNTSENVPLYTNKISSIQVKCEKTNEFPVPESTRILEHQIAGHFHGQGKTKLGILKHKDGSILKPIINNDPRGIRELEFYEKVFHNCNNLETSVLQTFLPQYKGTWETIIDGNEIKYLSMNDVTEVFIKPCILDIKIGSCTYDPEASPEKILQETIKYPTSAITGFRILGMRIFCHSTCKFLYLDKHYGKQQTPETIADALFLYLNKSCDTAVHAILCGFLHKLYAIENWFKVQKSFAFYSSSLLFVYEGEHSVWEQWNKEIGIIKNLTFIPNSREDNMIEINNETLSKISHSNLNSFVKDGTLHLENRIGSCSICGLSLDICRKICKMNEKDTGFGNSVLFDIHMIDFAHVFPSDNIDQNYLFGLRRLIGYLKVLQVRIWKKFTYD